MITLDQPLEKLKDVVKNPLHDFFEVERLHKHIGDLVDQIHVPFAVMGLSSTSFFPCSSSSWKKVYGIKDRQHILRIAFPTDRNVLPAAIAFLPPDIHFHW